MSDDQVEDSMILQVNDGRTIGQMTDAELERSGGQVSVALGAAGGEPEVLEGFAAHMASERERLTKERESVLQQMQESQDQLADIDREYAAIEAYENAKAGKAPVKASRARSSESKSSRSKAAGTGSKRGRKGGRREELFALVRDHGPMSRGEILDHMGFKGDKSGEMSVSNALTALTKSNQLARVDKKYQVVAAAE
jgi:Fe2+ or Zn2+ uptake regulation protein